jgi:WD40 repeat protein
MLEALEQGAGPVPGDQELPKDAVRSQYAQAGRDVYAAAGNIVINQGGQASLVTPAHPAVDGWVSAVHATPDDVEPLGCGVVLDDYRILTCLHVIEGAADQWIAFPRADEADGTRRQVARVIRADAGAPVKDLAILVLAEPVPAGVPHAPLRCPRPNDLVSKRWWAFGFPKGDTYGNSADGVVGTALGYGLVRLDTGSRYKVERGYSGGGVWSPNYQAVVAVVVHADGIQGDGRAITLHQADLSFKDQKLRVLAEHYVVAEAGEVALAAWGWSLAGDSEGRRHWRPRARGVSIESERGYRFRGRSAALRSITGWLDRAVADRRVLVVTGAPGAGKSAVLGRIVTTADADVARELPSSDTAVRASVGSVACAVHAKGLTALEVATRIATAASAALPERVEDLAPSLRSALEERAGSRFNVVIDALDEAASPAEARLIAAKVIVPLAETCWDLGAQVVAGSRRADTDGDLLGALGEAARLIDLDQPEYFAVDDLTAYALAALQLAGDERAGSPYASEAVAGPVAARIAELSGGNFLIAGLTARTHGLYDEAAVDPAALSFSARVDDAMREYLARVPPVYGASTETLLTALAFAESPGLPAGLWQTTVRALGGTEVPEAALRTFARSSAANFIVESSGSEDGGAEFRLFHQALNDALRHGRARLVSERDDERALTRAFLAVGQAAGWDRAPGYLLRALPGHAARARLMDDLLADDGYLLHADLLRVQPLADRATTEAGRQRARLLRLSPRDVLTAGAPERAAMFSVTEILEDLPGLYTHAAFPGPYRAAWTTAPPSEGFLILRGHRKRVSRICTVLVNGVPHLATASNDLTVRVWNPADGTQVHVLTGHEDWIMALCTVLVNGVPHLATASDDLTVRVWNPADGTQVHVLTGHQGWVRAMCTVTVHGIQHLATASDDGTVRVWNPADGSQVCCLTGHQSQVRAICAITLGGTACLATGGNDRTIRIWDPATGAEARVITGVRERIRAICAVTIDEVPYLAIRSKNGAMQIWSAVTGTQIRAPAAGKKDARPLITIDDRRYLAEARDGAVRIQDPADGSLPPALTGPWGKPVCPIPLNGTTHLATGGDDGTIRIWNPADGSPSFADSRSAGKIAAICALAHDTAAYLATVTQRTIEIWNPADGSRLRSITHHSQLNAICAFSHYGGVDLATANYSGEWVQIWNPADGTEVRTVTQRDAETRAALALVQDGTVGEDRSMEIWDTDGGGLPAMTHGIIPGSNAICVITVNDVPCLAAASNHGAIRIWDPVDGTEVRTLAGHADLVSDICAVTVNGIPHLATASEDKTVRIWDPADGAHVRSLAGHDGPVNAVCAVPVGDGSYLATGSSDSTIRIWDPADGTCLHTLTGHDNVVTGICAFILDGTACIATSSRDRTVRVWDPAVKASRLVIPTRDGASAVAYADGLLFVGTETGMLAVRLDADYLARSAR